MTNSPIPTDSALARINARPLPDRWADAGALVAELLVDGPVPDALLTHVALDAGLDAGNFDAHTELLYRADGEPVRALKENIHG